MNGRITIRNVLTERTPATEENEKKGGTKSPRFFLVLTLFPPPHTHTPQEKNVSRDSVDGRVGRVYVPPQDLGNLPTALSKGVKRGRRTAGEGGDAGKRPRAEE